MRQVHFSIDDTGRSFRYITRNMPNSIFDLTLYGTLRRWHEDYGLKVTLYCLALIDQFLLSEIPNTYSVEFRENAEWLRFGFHGKSALPFREETGYQAGYELVDTTLNRLGAGRADGILRMHCWTATPEQKLFLLEQGVHTLLYPDDDCLKYNDHDFYYDCGLCHRRTRIRYEAMRNVQEESLHTGRDFLAAFTHEWCFAEQKEKIEESLAVFQRNGYEFI